MGALSDRKRACYFEIVIVNVRAVVIDVDGEIRRVSL
jgi:hypothetical protein